MAADDAINTVGPRTPLPAIHAPLARMTFSLHARAAHIPIAVVALEAVGVVQVLTDTALPIRNRFH